jgi:hypothetical protein
LETDIVTKAQGCLKFILNPELDHVIGFLAGMEGGVFSENPNKAIDLIRGELFDAESEIMKKH